MKVFCLLPCFYLLLVSCAPKNPSKVMVEVVPTETILNAICTIEDRRHESGESSDYYRNEHMDAYQIGERSPEALLLFISESSMACRGALVQLMAMTHGEFLIDRWSDVSAILTDSDKIALIRGISVNELSGFEYIIFELLRGDHSELVKAQSASLLTGIDQSAWLDEIKSALADTSSSGVLSSILLSVDLDKAPEIVPTLETLFDHPDDRVHEAIMNNMGLAEFDGKKAFLSRYLDHPSEKLRQGAASRLEALKNKDKLEKAVTVNILEQEVQENILDKEFLEALDGRDSARIKLLLANGVNVNGVDETGRPLISIATRRSKGWLVREILAMGADPNQKDPRGQTALHLACMVGYPSIVNTLLLYGADQNLPDNEGQSPLDMAKMLEHDKVLKRLEKGPTEPGENSPFLKAVWEGDEEKVIAMLDGGTNIEERDSDGNTPLLMAASAGKEAMVRLLVKRGAFLGARNNLGWSARTTAAVEGHGLISELLGELAAIEKNNISLLAAVEKGDVAGAELYLEKGADLKAVDASGRNALMIAVSTGKTAMVELFLKKGLDPNASTWEDMNAFEYAKTIGEHGVVAVLEQYR